MESIKDKTLVMIVGPAAIGKSSLMNVVVAKDDEFGRVSGFTTRPARSNDEPGMYRYISADEATNLIERDDVIQHAVHPTTGAMYGSQAVDYPKAYNMLDTLSNVVDNLRGLPFKRTVTVSLTTNPDNWQDWFLKRYPNPSQERTKRLEEAIISIEWSLAQLDDHFWLVNAPDSLTTTADRLISIVRQSSAPIQVPVEATMLLDRAKSLLSYK